MTKPNYIALDVEALRTKLEALNAKYADEFAEDGQLHMDVLEGETNLDQVLSRLLDEKQETDAMVAAMQERERNQETRRKRFEAKANALREWMLELMQSANLTSITLPQGTISLAKGRESVVIINVADLPQGYVAMEPKVDKSGIGKALKAGEDIPGAKLEVGAPSLSIRSK